MKGDVYEREMDTADELLARILDAAARINKHEDQLRQNKNAIVAHELQSALRLAVGFAIICCDR